MNRLMTAILVAGLLAGAAFAQAEGPTCITTYPFLETFDALGPNGTTGMPPNWVNVATDAFGSNSDWVARTFSTPSSGTGPSEDHTTGVPGVGFYVHTEDSSSEFAGIELQTPCFDLATLALPVLRFCYHSNDSAGGANQNFLHVDVENVTTGVKTFDVIPPIGHVDDEWNVQVVDLSAFAGDMIVVTFRGSSDNGSFTHDLAIDDVSLRDGVLFDIGITDLVSPVGAENCNDQLGPAEFVIVDAINNADFPIPAGATIGISYQIDSGTPVMETFIFGFQIEPGGTFPLSFNTTANLVPIDATDTEVNILVSVDPVLSSPLPADPDANPADNTRDELLDKFIPDEALLFADYDFNDDSLSFNGDTTTDLPDCHTQVDENPGGTSLDVQLANENAAFPGTGPPGGDPTTPGGNYLFMRGSSTSGVTNAVAAVRTPVLEMPANGDRVKTSMDVWSNDTTGGQVGNTFSVNILDASDDTVFLQDLIVVGHVGNDWQEMAFAIPTGAPNMLRLELCFDMNGGSGHSFGVDNIRYETFTAGSGNPPSDHARLSVTDAAGNHAVDVNGLRPDSNVNGPYFIEIELDGQTYRIKAEPNAPVAMLIGDLNPGNINLGSLGTIDIGMGLNDIAIFADGNASGPVNQFFRTDGNGELQYSLNFPTGLLPNLSWQCAAFNPGSGVTLSNAVQVMPAP